MSYNYCKDHRSGITYVYEITKTVDESSGKAKTSRKLVGKLDEEGNIVPTSGRKGRLPKSRVPETDGTQDEEALRHEISALKSTVALLRQERQELIKGLEDLLAMARR